MKYFGMDEAGNINIGLQLESTEWRMKHAKTVAQQVDAAEKFILSYKNMMGTPRFPEADSEITRNCVFTELERILIRSGGFSEHRAYEILDHLWEKYL